ncbi:MULTISPECIES: hypothetical protein [unclassified Nonomuraea]|uniref:hypothetical protein n=1 Tax=unclassified Nonomuraea TaxID=2593643 RepID=UPI0033E9CC23
MALLAHVAKLIKDQGYTGRVVVLHNDLGKTPSGEPIEWPGVAALAREHAEKDGFEFYLRPHPRLGRAVVSARPRMPQLAIQLGALVHLGYPNFSTGCLFCPPRV